MRPVTHCLLFSLVKSLCCVSSPGSDSTGWVQLEFPQCFSSHFDEFVPEKVQIYCRKVSPWLNATHWQSFFFPVCLCRWHSSSQVFCQMSSANVRLKIHSAEQGLLPWSMANCLGKKHKKGSYSAIHSLAGTSQFLLISSLNDLPRRLPCTPLCLIGTILSESSSFLLLASSAFSGKGTSHGKCM